MKQIALWTCLLWPTVLLAQPPKLGVSPSLFEIHIDEDGSKTHSFRVFNYDDDAFEAEVSINNWDLDENNKTRILPPEEQSLDQWIAINPVRFTVPPKSSQVVRFSVRPRVQPHPGEHRAMIFVTSKPAETKQLSMRFTLRYGLAVYAYAGEVSKLGILHGTEVDATTAWFDISSKGSAHVRLGGQYAVWQASSFPGAEATQVLADLESLPEAIVLAGDLRGKPVLPGTRRRIPLRLDGSLPPGDYVLDLNGSLGEADLDTAVRFSVEGSPPEASGQP